MKWEEEFALMQREVIIDSSIIKSAIINVTSELNYYFKKHGISNQVITDEAHVIRIPGLKDIKIEERDNLYVIKSSLEDDIMYAEIEAVKGMFEISYYTTASKTIKIYNLTDKIVSKVIGNVLFQKEKEIIE